MTAIFGVEGKDGRLLAHPLLNRAVELLWDWKIPPKLECSPRGKPYFSGRSDRWLSLSHSGGYALCALSEDGPVGVDIEVVRLHRVGLPDYVLSPEERMEYDGSWEKFTQLWTLKESWCKREDSSLYPPRKVTVPAECPRRSYAGPGWRAAVCCTGQPPREIRWLAVDELF